MLFEASFWIMGLHFGLWVSQGAYWIWIWIRQRNCLTITTNGWRRVLASARGAQYLYLYLFAHTIGFEHSSIDLSELLVGTVTAIPGH